MGTANQMVIYGQDTRRQQQKANKNTPYQVRCPTPGHLAEGEVARDDSDFVGEIYEYIYNKK